MDVNALKTDTGKALDAAGAEINLPRVTIAGGHGFDETDDSYRRRLIASVSGAEAAGAMSQPADIVQEAKGDEEPAAEPESSKAPELKQDGPTVEEWVLAGYHADAYPPEGYASRSTPEEIAAAITAQKAAAEHIPHNQDAGTAGHDPKASGVDGESQPHLP